jgi:hypothetical protein
MPQSVAQDMAAWGAQISAWSETVEAVLKKKQVVLLPFPRENSSDHLKSTVGYEDEVAIAQEKRLKAAIKTMKDQYKDLRTAKGAPGYTDVARKYFDQLDDLENKYDRLRTWQPGWRDISAENVVCADDESLAGAIGLLWLEHDQLYIRGHCSPGSDTLQSSDKSVEITVRELIDVIAPNLTKSFSGRIKIFACSSAKDTLTTDSFAYKFAKSLADEGWVRARVIGYSTDLQTFVTDSKRYKTTVEKSRAKDAQVEVTAKIRTPRSL